MRLCTWSCNIYFLADLPSINVNIFTHYLCHICQLTFLSNLLMQQVKLCNWSNFPCKNLPLLQSNLFHISIPLVDMATEIFHMICQQPAKSKMCHGHHLFCSYFWFSFILSTLVWFSILCNLAIKWFRNSINEFMEYETC